MASSIAVLSILGGLLTYHIKRAQGHTSVEQTLRTITNLKAQELAAWRRERQGDILTLAEALLLPRSAAALLFDQTATNAVSRLTGHLEAYRTRYGYRSAVLFGADRRVVVATPATVDLGTDVAPAVLDAMHHLNGLYESGFHPMRDGTHSIAYLAPIGESHTNANIGAVLLVADLDRNVLSLLDTESSPLHSAESFLISTASEGARCVNRRWQRSPPAKADEVAARSQMTALVLADGSAASGVFEGPDDRGTPSLAVYQKVPDSHWKVLYKADISEFTRPALTGALISACGILFLLSLLGVVLKVRAQDRELRLVERQMVADRTAAEALRRLGVVLRNSKDVILVVDQEMRILEANGSTTELYGYEQDELVGRSMLHLRAPQAKATAIADFQKIIMGPGGTLETIHARRNGDVFPVEVCCTPARVGEELHVLAVVRDVSVRKQAEEKLAQRNELLAAIFSQAVDAIAVFEPESWRLIEFNSSAHADLGYDHAEFSNLRLMDLTPKDEFDRLKVAIDILAIQPTATLETRIRTKDGNVRHIRLRLRQLAVKDLTGIAATWTDITARKQMEARTRAQRQRAEMLLELYQHAPQMSDSGLYESVLQQVTKLTGSTFGFLYRVSADQREFILSTWPAVANRPASARFEDRYPLADATSWIEAARERRTLIRNDCEQSTLPRTLAGFPEPLRRYMGAPVLENGEIRIIFGVGNRDQAYTDDDAQDLQAFAEELQKITTLRIAESRLRQLSCAVDQNPATILITDTTGAIVYANPKFVHTTGYTVEEALGQNPRILKSGRMPEEEYRQLWDTILRGDTWRGEMCNKRKNGEIYWEHAAITAIKDSTGTITHFIAVKEDITERRRLEDDLRQSQKLEAIGQLAGGVAHDFNNILAAMMLQLSMLQAESGRDQETLAVVNDLLAEAKRASSLVRQLLMFSRRSVLKMQPVQLAEVVDGLLKMLRRLIGEHIELNYDCAPNLPEVQADAGMLEQVLTNLVVNARDAISKTGRITIKLTLADFDHDASLAKPPRRAGNFLCVSVSDTGCGMDAATLERIFEPFFTTKEQGKGTGLGLATAHGIVAQHKGWFEVESQLGRGAIFHVYLPALKPRPTAKPPPVSDRPIPQGSERILLVEDEEILRRQVRTVLLATGYKVRDAGSAADALEVWRSEDGGFDLLLTDMVMPGDISGIELATQLLRIKPDLRVIISTGYSDEILARGQQSDHRISSLPKPYGLDQLARTIRSALEHNPPPLTDASRPE